ncbi:MULTISPECIES: cyclic-di-AMP receptor [Tissierellales]|jgi:uncharacterized protein YaaQ|uniref:Transcriptional regulator n=1 Tax=Acidilutibacter cellobiosedens TaxID=2507161 RepID=A0A410Q9H7_9FIRM|nr:MULTISPECIES: cyclic-di-AMP receptor [Tissierellales]MBE6082087.1 hypothetical protein [Tissierellaceae bacterium]QAT60534.1 hypothetical protein EQM13_02555 [Acidilutibacter cellobiosedens]SCL86770.1 hypothetical protein PP176A_1152 [Sporanaerobacter sp. PP17-6a]
MKLIIVIIHNEDENRLIKELIKNRYQATKLSSTGGFLKSGNTTLLVGAEDEKVEEIVDIIKSVCRKETKNKENRKDEQGGTNIFIMNVDKFRKM